VPLVQAETGVSLADHEKGKPSQTIFEHVGYDSATDTRCVRHGTIDLHTSAFQQG
jgi:hypothetical protein